MREERVEIAQYLGRPLLGLVQRRWKAPHFPDSYSQFADFSLAPIARSYHANRVDRWPGSGFVHFALYRKR